MDLNLLVKRQQTTIRTIVFTNNGKALDSLESPLVRPQLLKYVVGRVFELSVGYWVLAKALLVESLEVIVVGKDGGEVRRRKSTADGGVWNKIWKRNRELMVKQTRDEMEIKGASGI